MVNKSRPLVITGNWKMYKTIDQALAFIQGLLSRFSKTSAQIYLAVPFTAIKPAADLVRDSECITLGAQNMFDASEGAFTGEVAATMLVDAGARFVLLGHSERRRFFNEDNAFINKKVHRALKENLQPILCIGETLAEREAGAAEAVLTKQISECLAGVKIEQAACLMVAYEPVWAIGTDQVATPEIAQQMHAFCRAQLTQLFGPSIAEKTVIQYGGSVKAENAAELIKQPDIDGLLVGGASLSVESFSKIIDSTLHDF